MDRQVASPRTTVRMSGLAIEARVRVRIGDVVEGAVQEDHPGHDGESGQGPAGGQSEGPGHAEGVALLGLACPTAHSRAPRGDLRDRAPRAGAPEQFGVPDPLRRPPVEGVDHHPHRHGAGPCTAPDLVEPGDHW